MRLFLDFLSLVNALLVITKIITKIKKVLNENSLNNFKNSINEKIAEFKMLFLTSLLYLFPRSRVFFL